MTIPCSNMTTKELIKQADTEDNKLALALIDSMESGSDAVSALVTALGEAFTNVESFVGELSKVLQDEFFDDIHIGEQIAELADHHGSPLSSELAIAIDKLLTQEKERYKLAIAQVWIKSLLTGPESVTLKKDCMGSVECPSVFSDLQEVCNFDNPFQTELDNYEKEQKARRDADRLYRENLRINQPVTKRKRK